MNDRIILHITPQPYVKVLPGESRLFGIPERCNYIPSETRFRRRKEFVDIRILGCELWNNTGYCRHTSSAFTRKRLKRIFKYNDYKKEIRKLCELSDFMLPTFGQSIYFYFPLTRSWSKKKKTRMAGQMKFSKPDLDNLLKGFWEGLGKQRGEVSDRLPDEFVAQLSGTGKFWMNDFDATRGYIEILLHQPLYNPFNVKFDAESYGNIL